MERTVFCPKERGTVGDRFIARRESLQPDLCKHKLLHQVPTTSVFDHFSTSKSLKTRNYINYLDSTLHLPPPDQKLLSFCLPHEKARVRQYPAARTWPCRPRRTPCIGSADSVLDLPNYGASYWSHEVVDWGRHNSLLAALGNKLYVWSWQQQSLVCGALASSAANCGKFSPAFGNLIAVALESGHVETFQVETGKPVSRASCHGDEECCATALDWSPTGKSLVLGCSKGGLTVLDSSLTRVARRTHAHTSAVLRVRVSPDARYLASLAYGQTCVSTWLWPHLKPYYIFENTSIVKSIAWHPWQSSMLGIGGSCARPGVATCVLAVWDVAPARLRVPAVKSSRSVAVDCMLFSHVTGEMVVSCWMQDDTASGSSERASPFSRITVLSDTSCEVDKWHMTDRVNTMMFSPDGNKLAVATADEDLVILYFLPEEPKWKSSNHSNSHSALAVMLDEAENGFSKR